MNYKLWKEYRRFGLIAYSVDNLMDLVHIGEASWFVPGTKLATDGETIHSLMHLLPRIDNEMAR